MSTEVNSVGPLLEGSILDVGDRVRVVRAVRSQDRIRQLNFEIGSYDHRAPVTHGGVTSYPHPWSGDMVGDWAYGMSSTIGAAGTVIDTLYRREGRRGALHDDLVIRPDAEVQVRVDYLDGSHRLWWYSRLALEKIEVQQSEETEMNNQESNQVQGNVPALTPGLAVPRAVEPSNEVPAVERPVFHVGQEVRIERKVYALRQMDAGYTLARIPERERATCLTDPFWHSQWTVEMDDYVGSLGRVIDIDARFGIRVHSHGHGSFWFSPLSLSAVAETLEAPSSPISAPAAPTAPELRPGQVQPQATALQAALGHIQLAVPELRSGLALATQPAARIQPAETESQTLARPVFQVGDEVRIVRKVLSTSDIERLEDRGRSTEGILVDPDWDNTWTERMDRFIGSTGVVRRVDGGVTGRSGVYVYVLGENQGWGFSPLSLELVRQAGEGGGVIATPSVPELRPGLVQPAEGPSAEQTDQATTAEPSQFRVGDRVRVERRVYSAYQQDIPDGAISCSRTGVSWYDCLEETLGMSGVIDIIDGDGDVYVQLEGEPNYFYSPLSLVRVAEEESPSTPAVSALIQAPDLRPGLATPAAQRPEEAPLAAREFLAGDRVRVVRKVVARDQVNDDESLVDPRLDAWWIRSMDSTIGREGVVDHVGYGRDVHYVHVTFGDTESSFNYSPLALELVGVTFGSTELQVDNGGAVVLTGPRTGRVSCAEDTTSAVHLPTGPALRAGLVSSSAASSSTPLPVQEAGSAANLLQGRVYMVLGGAYGEGNPVFVLGVLPEAAYLEAQSRLLRSRTNASLHQGRVEDELLLGEYVGDGHQGSPFLKALIRNEYGQETVPVRIDDYVRGDISKNWSALKHLSTVVLVGSHSPEERVRTDDVEMPSDDDRDPLLWMSLVEMSLGEDFSAISTVSINALDSLVYDDR